MKRSQCCTSPPLGESTRAMNPGGRGSPQYSATARSCVRETFTFSVMPRLSLRKRPRCRNAVCGTSSAFSSAENNVPFWSSCCRTVTYSGSSARWKTCGRFSGIVIASFSKGVE